MNALLSFCYALLVKETLAACLIVGFDPYVGLFHRPRFGRPALALDLAAEFRPLLAASVVLTLVNNREIGASDFVVRAGAVSLTDEGRRKVLRAWERRMTTGVKHPVFGYHVTGSTGTLFLYGIVVGAIALLGLSLLLVGASRTSRRGRVARHGLKESHRQTVALRRERDTLVDQRGSAQGEVRPADVEEQSDSA